MTLRGNPVPKAFQIQMQRLFGEYSVEGQKTTRTPREWKQTLRRVLHEIDRYVTANIDTDSLHHIFLASGLYAADQSLNEEDFWPGYAEGITRFALTLLGDYPDHHQRKTGAKSDRHYRLDRYRTLRYIQNRDQRLVTLIMAENVVPGFSKPPREALAQFREEFGFRVGYREFFQWYRKHYPSDYSAVF